MEWRDRALILGLRPHGEISAIVELFSPEHGRFSGVVRAGQSRKVAPHIQPGNLVQAHWKSRVEGQLGALSVEPIQSRAVLWGEPLALSAMLSACSLLQVTQPEQAPDPMLWHSTAALLDNLARAAWYGRYLQWELALLDQSGFGLDLTQCAVTGQAEGLVYVSPKTGRAVCAAGAGEWADRLLRLPSVLQDWQGFATSAAMTQVLLWEGLQLTGYFLPRALSPDRQDGPHKGKLPEARHRFLTLLARQKETPHS